MELKRILAKDIRRATEKAVALLKIRVGENSPVDLHAGMDMDEVLRLCQITGLAEAFSNQEFSKAWDVEGAVTESDFKELTDNVDELNSHINSMDSLDMTDMVFHIEEKFGIRFEDRFVFENFEKLCPRVTITSR